MGRALWMAITRAGTCSSLRTWQHQLKIVKSSARTSPVAGKYHSRATTKVKKLCTKFSYFFIGLVESINNILSLLTKHFEIS